jgi:beta-N-acetylhexosaminidase
MRGQAAAPHSFGNIVFHLEELRQGRVPKEWHYSLGVTTHRRLYRARTALTCAIGAACVAIAGCGLLQPGAGPAASALATAHPPASGGDPAPTVTSVAAACVNQVYGQLTDTERVGQLFLVGVDGDVAGPELTRAERAYHFGSLLLNVSVAGTAALRAQTAQMQALAPRATGGVRFFIAANQEGGNVQQLTGPGFDVMPTALTQGSEPASALRQAAAVWGAQLHAAGVNLDLAPVMDVVPPGTAANNQPIGQYQREFGFDPAVNGPHGAAFIAGMRSSGVATSAKHFPGLGRVIGNTDHVANVVDQVTGPDDPYLASFAAAVKAGVPVVMLALASYPRIDPGHLAAFSPAVNSLLRDKLGFTGVITSDDLGQAVAVQSIPPRERALGFIEAGGDLITSQNIGPAEEMAAALLAGERTNPALRAEVAAAVERVLALKRAYGLLPC